MIKTDWDRMTAGRTPLADVLAKAHAAARQYREFEARAYVGLSGADRADAPADGITADALCLLAAGADLAEVMAWADGAWKAYRADVLRKIEAAPRITRGPMSGQSSRHYMWVSEDAGRRAVERAWSFLVAWGAS